MVAELVFWTPIRSEAAALLAAGKSQLAVARELNIDPKTVYNWLKHPEFASEVDRLSVMVGISSRAERLRIAMRVVRQRVNDETGNIVSDRDILDWLKYAQSETDGVKLDLSKLAEMTQGGEDNQRVQAQLPAAIDED